MPPLRCCTLLLFSAAIVAAAFQPTLLYEWVSLDYDWPSPEMRANYITSGQFIVQNNALAGVKSWNGEYYVTVPRWRPGVPSTLNKIVNNGTANVLQPYPSWEMQEIGNFSALQFVQSMEIDTRGWMWILDVGRLNILSADPSQIVNGPAKLLVWDIEHGCAVREFVFPDEVLPYNNSWANDIVLDETHGFAFITDTKPTGGIIVYDFNNNQARRFDDLTMHGVSGNNMTINYTTYAVAPMGTDGIALSHDTTTLYYCDISRETLFAIETKYLQNFQLPSQNISQHLQTIGTKGYSDGMTFTSGDSLIFGSEADSAVVMWNIHSDLRDAVVIAQDNETMEWIDTFGFDGSKLLFTSNKLLKYLFNVMQFDGSDGANFRVWQVDLENQSSYLQGQEPNPKELPCLVSQNK